MTDDFYTDATNFSSEFIQKINAVLEFVLESKHSDFYRKKYGEVSFYPVQSYEDFKKIPFLIKDDILSVKIGDRIFVKENDISYYSFSSGTTNNAIPTIIPHCSYTHLWDTNEHKKEPYVELGVKKILLLLPPNHGFLRNALAKKRYPVTYTVGDLRNLKLMATIIQNLGIDGIVTSPTALDFLNIELAKINFDYSSIKFISLGSEFCTSMRYDYFKKIFPSAKFQMRYGNSEQGSGKRNYRCNYLEDNAEPNVFHVDEKLCLIEIVDENGKALNFGETGQIIYTDLREKAFPLVRYKLNDMGSLHVHKCPCGNNIVLKMDGRAGYDILKVHGVTLNSEMISKALKTVETLIEPKFQLHVSEEKFSNKMMLQLELHLKMKNQADVERNLILHEIISEKISHALKISASRNLKDLIEDGYFLPLRIKFVTDWPSDLQKFKNIITHF